VEWRGSKEGAIRKVSNPGKSCTCEINLSRSLSLKSLRCCIARRPNGHPHAYHLTTTTIAIRRDGQCQPLEMRVRCATLVNPRTRAAHLRPDRGPPSFQSLDDLLDWTCVELIGWVVQKQFLITITHCDKSGMLHTNGRGECWGFCICHCTSTKRVISNRNESSSGLTSLVIW
jgi:hypothetical protein